MRTEWGKQCQFPFYYKGAQREFCTMTDHHRTWCSLNGHIKHRGVDWDNCVSMECSGNILDITSKSMVHYEYIKVVVMF